MSQVVGRESPYVIARNVVTKQSPRTRRYEGARRDCHGLPQEGRGNDMGERYEGVQ
jgi:hypothetical protein